jgi:DNA-directed RNA polymerase specialized sigma24 family protein
MVGGDDPKYYTVDEAEQLLRDLSDATQRRLAMLARVQAYGVSGGDWRDLLQEAYTRVLEGRRRWPRHLDVATFFWQTLRSLVSGVAKGRERAKQQMDVLLASEVPGGDSDDPENPTDIVENHPGDALTPEREVFEATARESFLENLGDPITRDVAEWLLAGFKKDEIMRDLDLDDTAYDTHTKRIRRAAARLILQEAPE